MLWLKESEQVDKVFQDHLRRVDNIEDCRSLLHIKDFKKEIRHFEVVAYVEGKDIDSLLKKTNEIETENRKCLNIKCEENILEEIFLEKRAILIKNERIFIVYTS